MLSQSVSRLAQNSLWLYMRSIIVMLVTLYTSRLVLQTLGVEDFGIYSVVGSVVLFFSFFDSSFSAACQRFYNIELGKGNLQKLAVVFNTSLWLLLVIASVMFAIIEIVGLYLISNYLSIPEERIDASIWVFHFSALTMVINMLCIPFNSLIIAHENMTTYAYFDIFNSFLKLACAISLFYVCFDTLIYYGIVLFLIQFAYQLMCAMFCFSKFKEAKITFLFDTGIAKQIGSFSGWVILNAVSSIFIFQGLSILYNMYWGVIANAALGIANQVRGCALRLTQNFSISLTPQLTQNYAKGNLPVVNIFFLTGSKLIYYIFSIITIVLIVCTDFILDLWLKDVPDFTVGFVRILLFNCITGFVGCMSGALINATGKIAKYQVVNALISYMALLSSFFFFHYHISIYAPYIIIAISSLVQSIYNIYLGAKALNISCVHYLISFSRIVVANFIIVISALSTRPDVFHMDSFAVWSICLIILTSVSEFYIGFDKKERQYIQSIIVQLFNKIQKK